MHLALPTGALKVLEPLSGEPGERKSLLWAVKEESTLASCEAFDDVIQGCTEEMFSLEGQIHKDLFLEIWSADLHLCQSTHRSTTAET